MSNPLLAALASKPLIGDPRPDAEPAADSQERTNPDDAWRLQPSNLDYGPAPDYTADELAALPSYAEADAVPGREFRHDGEWRPLIEPMKIVNGIVKSRNIIIATTVAGALLGVALALSTPKRYESVAELLVDPRDLKIANNEITQSSLPSDATLAIVENQVRVMTSGNVLEKVVDRLNLQNDPEFNGRAGGFSPRALISELRSIFSRDEGGVGDVRRALAIRNLGESLDVERGGRTFVVSVGVTTHDPQKSALIANTLTDTFLQTYGDIQSGSAGRASDELTSRLAELQASVEAAERKVEAYKSENDIIDAGGRLISDDEMVKLNDQLSVARARTIELNARAASARNLDLNAVVGGELPEQIASPVMGELRTQYAVAKQEVERLSVRLGPRHPERLAAEAQLAGAQQSMTAELRRITASIQVELKRAVQLEQDLASRLAQIKARQSGVSEDLVTLRELEREAAAKRAVYESFLLRARETGEQRGMNTANMSVISVAQPPLEALGPSRAMIVLASTVLGFLAGVGIGGVRGAADSLRDGSDPAPQRVPSLSLARRLRRKTARETAESIDSIMRAAAKDVTAPEAIASAAPGATDPIPTASTTPHEATAMHPVYPYPYYPTAPGLASGPIQTPGLVPGQPPSQAWYDQQAAAHAAHQQALHQAYAQQAYAQQPLPYAPPQQYGPPYAQHYGQPHYAQPPMIQPQPWPPNYPQPPQHAWPQHAAWPPAAQPRAPEPPQAYSQAYPEPSPVDEIRESLREFREAVRDLTERRARSRDA